MIEGSCHCGAVHWTFEGQPDGATACNCTVCRRYGALWAYDYDGEGIKVKGETRPYVRSTIQVNSSPLWPYSTSKSISVLKP